MSVQCQQNAVTPAKSCHNLVSHDTSSGASKQNFWDPLRLGLEERLQLDPLTITLLTTHLKEVRCVFNYYHWRIMLLKECFKLGKSLNLVDIESLVSNYCS